MASATSSGPLTESIKDDHQEMYDYYDKYTEAHAAGNEKDAIAWANQLVWEVVRHAVGEEIVVYPLMEKHMGDEGKRLADEDRKEHHTVKQLLYDFESLRTSSVLPGKSNETEIAEQQSTILKAVMDHLHKHNDSEEQNDLPYLEPKLGVEGSKKAAGDFKRTKKFAPTLPHPSAPDQPPFETVVGLMQAPIDKLLDLFKTFPSAELKAELKESKDT
ncbi:hypothetical protein SCHPADRAFT_825155 [Schizopora paradoxa]|uniref:Hemerythrin-like domain-containing protein n=1 Tax=Schizopora paradoxa TaxID=27342 RepID=A0A0H2RTN6_9AGAM|nr:hypothetical protein SCHPADRAFT_825155 [Schizopora paradoxa]